MSTNNPDVELFIRLFRRLRLPLIGWFLLSVVVAGFVMMPRILKYRGVCTFYVAPDPQGPELLKYQNQEVRAELKRVNRGYERVLQFVYSAKMMDHIIRVYDLYKHYGIDTTSGYYRERAYAILSSRTEIYKVNSDITRIAVTDRNNELAAAMTNTMVSYLNRLNKEYLQQSMQKDVELYRNYIKESEKAVAVHQQLLDHAIDTIRTLTSRPVSPAVKQTLTEAGEDVRHASASISSIIEGSLNTLALYTQAVSITDYQSTNTVIILNKAIPEMNSKKSYVVIYAVMVGLGSSVLFLICAYFIAYYSGFLKQLFGR